jgi:hypothetical protein
MCIACQDIFITRKTDGTDPNSGWTDWKFSAELVPGPFPPDVIESMIDLSIATLTDGRLQLFLSARDQGLWSS